LAKSKYIDIDLKKISYLIEVQGYNHKQLIEYLGISRETFYNWIKKHTDFSDTIKKSKTHLVEEVKNKLIERARGIEYEEVTQEIKIVDGKEYKTVKKVKRFIPPSDTAIIFALANLDPKNWKRSDKVVEDKVTGNEDIKHTKTKEEIAKRIMNEDF
jgi:transposase-like protein